MHKYYLCQVAAHEAVETMLKDWKIEETERLLFHLDEMQTKRKEAENHTQKTMENKYSLVSLLDK